MVEGQKVVFFVIVSYEKADPLKNVQGQLCFCIYDRSY